MLEEEKGVLQQLPIKVHAKVYKASYTYEVLAAPQKSSCIKLNTLKSLQDQDGPRQGCRNEVTRGYEVQS